MSSRKSSVTNAGEPRIVPPERRREDATCLTAKAVDRMYESAQAHAAAMAPGSNAMNVGLSHSGWRNSTAVAIPLGPSWQESKALDSETIGAVQSEWSSKYKVKIELGAKTVASPRFWVRLSTKSVMPTEMMRKASLVETVGTASLVRPTARSLDSLSGGECQPPGWCLQ